MKKVLITILFASSAIIGFSQSNPKEKVPVDSVTIDTPILSIADMEKLNTVIMKQFDLTENSKYMAILKELQALIADGQKKYTTKKK